MNEPVKVPWSGWEITKVLGSGSFGSVYEIQRNVLGTITKAAMKVISVPRDTADLNDLISIGYDKESINARFLDELKGISNEYNMMDQLKGNANIIYCEDLYYEEKPDGYGYDLYIRMELLEPLIKAIPNPATEDQVIKLGIDMCNALSACKKHKIIHRDIKPSNILISKDGNFKLGDFGVSKTSERTAGGTKTGTYGFMAPEVYNNKPYNASVDIYSLGMVLYWMLNRRCGPFLPLPPTIPMAHQIDEAKQRRFNGEPIPAPIDGSDELKAIVLKACAFDPDERYSSPEELSAELEKLKYSSTVSNNDTISSLRPQQSTSQYESSYDERTMGNNWGYTDEPTQGTQYGGEEIEQGGTVGRNYSEPKPVRESKKKNRSTNVQQPAASKSP
ncbi:MAG TPA: serine/threonine-protein kinase, partial [Ruminococcus sp.]|nr:serine/threonine-protein kinase [Ruminococcus sp.]